MKKTRLSILLTGAGAPGTRGTLYALRNNTDGLPIYTVGTDIKDDVVGRHFVDRFYQIPGPDSKNYIDRIIEITRQELIDIIIPQTTREVSVLSQYKDAFTSLNVNLMCSNAGAIEIANDKFRLVEVFKKLALPYPKYKITGSAEDLINAAREMGYPERPVVVKPPVSNGMRGFRIIRENAWDAERFLTEKPNGVEISLADLSHILKRGDKWPQLLVTEYLPGPEYSVDAFIGKNISIALPRLRKQIRSGISFSNVLEYRKDIRDITLQAAKHIDLKYAFGFQFKLDSNNVPKVLECNPRVQGTMVASIFSGVNIIWLAIKELLGDPVLISEPPLKEGAFYRFWGGIGILDKSTHEI